MSSRVRMRMFCFSSVSCISRSTAFSVSITRSSMLPQASRWIFWSTPKGMFEQMKFRAITSLVMFFRANWASSGMSSFFFTNSEQLSRRASIAVLNSRSFSSGTTSRMGVIMPCRWGRVLTIDSKWHFDRP